nr:putative ribonuclease H-like domain-containing protein [Tanacetum cinerariifolium]
MIQVRLNVPVRRIRTDNGTEFVNQTLRDYYEEVGISHETSVACSPQQNGVVERRNLTLIEVARTMLIYAQALLLIWAEAVATACFTQNRSIIRLRHGKTPYELLHSKLPDLSFFHVFGALCYPTNDSENLESIHVDFDELTAMASEQSSLGPALNDMTPATISSGLVQKSSFSTPYVPPLRNDWDLLFQPMFDELLNPQPSIDPQAPEVIVSIAEVIPPVQAESTGSPSSTTVDQDAPSLRNTLVKTTSSTNIVSNTPVLSSIRVNLFSSASGSQPQGNTKNDRIQRTPRKAKKNKLEDHLRTVRPSLNKKSVVDTKAISSVTNSMSNVNSDLKCATTVKFRNDHVAKIMGYGDYTIGNVTILRVYFVEGLGHNLNLVGQFCDSDLEVAFRQHTCFVYNLDGVDLLTGSRGNNLYTLSLQDMMASSPICLLSKASKTKSWLWHRRLSHLNFEDVATACFAQNRSIIRLHHGKTPYELLHNKLPDLSFLHVFGTLCYLTNDSENLGKLQPKADIGIFIGYAPTKKAFRIYNRQWFKTRAYEMNPATISLGLVQKYSSSTSYVPPSRNDWGLLFQPMFDKLLNPPPSVDHQAAEVITPIADVIPPILADLTGSPSSTTVDQDAPSPIKSHTTIETQSYVIPQEIEEDNLDMEVAHIRNDLLFGVPILEDTSA